jgi:hypothetical protein
MVPVLLLAAMVVLNSSADVRVPLSVTVGGGQSGPQAAAPIAFDATTITGLVGLASALAYRWKKSDKHEQKFDNRTVTSAQTTMTQAESLKETDKGIEELLGGISTAVGLIPGVPDQAKKIIEDQLNAWKLDNQKYYDNNPAKPTDLSPDPVVKKLGEVQKISEPNG